MKVVQRFKNLENFRNEKVIFIVETCNLSDVAGVPEPGLISRVMKNPLGKGGGLKT